MGVFMRVSEIHNPLYPELDKEPSFFCREQLKESDFPGFCVIHKETGRNIFASLCDPLVKETEIHYTRLL
jgi:hypothetical protein